ncbi:putative site-specific recombinase [Oscillibacter valericigenes Sjm18-20]|nr:putative site-specific recombinase [Oscillibacter valericigenes Sjm18-20]
MFYPRKQRQKVLTPRLVANAFRNCCKNAGLPDTYTVHTLRHCFATHLLESDAEVCQIKELLGHTFIQTTAFYLHIGNMNKQIQSPLDTLTKKCMHKPKISSNA